MKQKINPRFFSEQIPKDSEQGDKVKLRYFTIVRSIDKAEGCFALHDIDHNVGDDIELDRNLRFFAYVPSIPAFERI